MRRTPTLPIWLYNLMGYIAQRMHLFNPFIMVPMLIFNIKGRQSRSHEGDQPGSWMNHAGRVSIQPFNAATIHINTMVRRAKTMEVGIL